MKVSLFSVFMMYEFAKEVFGTGKGLKVSYTMDLVYDVKGKFNHLVIVSKGNRIPSIEFSDDGTKFRFAYNGTAGIFKSNKGKWMEVKNFTEESLRGLRVTDDRDGSVVYQYMFQ